MQFYDYCRANINKKIESIEITSTLILTHNNANSEIVDENFWINRGDAIAKQGRYDEAVQAYDHAIQLNPNSALAWHARGLAFEKLGRSTQANAAFAKAEELGYSG